MKTTTEIEGSKFEVCPLCHGQIYVWPDVAARSIAEYQFCKGIHIETLTLLNQADHPTLNQICEENQSLRKQLAEAQKERDNFASEYQTYYESANSELAKNKAAAKSLSEAIRSLGEQSMDGPIYFEASPTLDPECFKRWKTLSDALNAPELRALIQPEEKK